MMNGSTKQKHAVRAAGTAAVILVMLSALFLDSFGKISSEKPDSRGLMNDFTAGVTGFSARALDGIYEIKRVYIIPESDTVAPAPHSDCYFSCAADDCGLLTDHLREAEEEGLVRTDELAWNDSTATWDNTPVEFYHDKTAFVIMWREIIGDCVYNFSEIFIAHPSQFRRMLTDDTYGSNTRQTTSTMAKSCNALVGMSGDYYGYRTPGVIVYKGKMCKNIASDSMDTCFVDSSGDLIMTKRRSLSDSQINDLIKEKEIGFSLSFGPIIVENGEMDSYYTYGFGQVKGRYTRACIGQIGRLHYLLCTVDGGNPGAFGTDLYTFAKAVYKKGVDCAYTLDGGQTATIFYDNRIYNRVGYGSERQISDIIYFATALD